MKKLVTLAVVAACSATAFADPLEVFNDNFESGAAAPQWSGIVSVENSEGYSAFGAGAKLLRNSIWPAATTTLTLTNLPAHDSVSINLLLGIIDSWDGDGSGYGPDGFRIKVDGSEVFHHTFAVATGSSNYVPPAGVFLGQGSYGFSGWQDIAYNLGNDPTLDNIPHTASTLTIDFDATGGGWQGGSDESFGLDNVQIVVNAVPAPGAFALAGAGALVGLRRRR